MRPISKSDRGHHYVVHEGCDDFAERRTDNETDSKIQHIAAYCKTL
jgi:hypothetical protein